jgi:Transposase DDE domain group 1
LCPTPASTTRPTAGHEPVGWWPRSSGARATSIPASVRLQLHALAYNLANFLRTLALPQKVEHGSLTTLREKLVEIGAGIVRRGRHAMFQLAEVAVPRSLFAEILRRIDHLRAPPLAG